MPLLLGKINGYFLCQRWRPSETGIEFAEFSLGLPQFLLFLGDCPKAVPLGFCLLLTPGAYSLGGRWLRLLAALQWGHLCLISLRRKEGVGAVKA